jgi:uncharacterized protein Yka (UPF0111/DUF47 family)
VKVQQIDLSELSEKDQKELAPLLKRYEELKEKQTRLFILRYEEHALLVRPMSRGDYKRLFTKLSDPKKSADAMEEVVSVCTFYPSSDGIEEMLDERPGLATTFGDKLLDIAGMSRDADAKKL